MRRGQMHAGVLARLAFLEQSRAARRSIPFAVIHADGHVVAEPGARVFANEAHFFDATASQDKPALLIRAAKTPEESRQ